MIMKRMMTGCLAALVLLGPGTMKALGATRTWSSSIYWFNPTGSAGAAQVDYYRTDGGVLSSNPTSIAAYAVGTFPQAAAPAGFAGSVVVSSDLPLVAVYRQEGTGVTVTAPELTAVINPAGAGLGQLFVPAVTLAKRLTTLINIQNLDGGDIDLTLDFHPVGAGAMISQTPAAHLKPGASTQVDPAAIPELGGSFSGSLVITAARVTDTSPALVAAVAQAVPTAGYKVYAYEAGPGAMVMNLPQAQCSLGTTVTRTTFEVQNTGAADAAIKVDYYYTTRGSGVTTVHQASSEFASLAPGRKLTADACAVAEVQGKKNLTAVFTSRDADDNPVSILAVGKVIKTGVGTVNAFTGLPAPALSADGKYRVALPLVRWAGAAPGYQTTVTVMNVEPQVGAGVTPAAVNLTWYRQDGATFGQTIQVYTRLSTNPSRAGSLTTGGDFKGAVVLESDRPIAALATMRNLGTTYSEGYTAIALP